LGVGPYCGFEIDHPDGLFLLGDFTITHNTSTALALARRMYDDALKYNMLFINGSDQRGIDVIRNTVMSFVNSLSFVPNNQPYKWIVFDEADYLTVDAQSALKTVMEKYSNIRFCFICNYVDKMIPALRSRCTSFRFPPVPKEETMQYLKSIATKESIQTTDDALEEVISLSGGDLRKCINILQSVSCSSANKSFTIESLFAVVNIPSVKQIKEMIQSIKDANKLMIVVNDCIGDVKDNNWDCDDVLKMVYYCLTSDGKYNHTLNPLITELAKLERQWNNSDISREMKINALVCLVFLHRKSMTNLQ
jgi:replication factor C subunit 3/5